MPRNSNTSSSSPSRPPGAAASSPPRLGSRRSRLAAAPSPSPAPSPAPSPVPVPRRSTPGYRVHMTVYDNPRPASDPLLPADWSDELDALRRDGTYFVPAAGSASAPASTSTSARRKRDPVLFGSLPARHGSGPTSDSASASASTSHDHHDCPSHPHPHPHTTMTQLDRVSRFDPESSVPPPLSDLAQARATDERSHDAPRRASTFSPPPAYHASGPESERGGPPSVDLRFGPIEIEFADAPDTASNGSPRSSSEGQRGPFAAFHAQSTFSIQDVPPSPDAFTTGSTDVTFGVVHLFRDQVDADQDARDPQPPPPPPPQQAEEMGTILAVLAVPATMTASDFLAFVEPAVGAISHLRMIRETLPNRAMVLLKFRDADDAEEFYKLFHGQPYSALRPSEICQVVYVTSVTISHTGYVPGTNASSAAAQIAAGITSGFQPDPPAGGAVTVGLQELPTCAVCLERLDASTSGLMTIACQHTFHCACLSRWGASRCPVCRYTSSPNGSTHAAARCVVCGAADDLWVCLLCAAVGCGRYSAADAHAHYQASGHRYALELDTQRVWDYTADRYVHRVLRTKGDGSLVELTPGSQSTAKRVEYPGESSSAAAATAEAEREAAADATATNAVLLAAAGRYDGAGEAGEAAAEKKLESVGLEFSYLLSSQLDKQRRYYEAALRAELRRRQEAERNEANVRAQLGSLQERQNDLSSLMEQTRTAATEAALARDTAVHETETYKRRAIELAGQLAQEKALSKALSTNLRSAEAEMLKVREQVARQRTELQDQQDMNRDLMFQIESMSTIGQSGVDELAGASVLPVPEKPLSRADQFRQRMAAADTAEPSSSTSTKKKKNKKNKKAVNSQRGPSGDTLNEKEES